MKFLSIFILFSLNIYAGISEEPKKLKIVTTLTVLQKITQDLAKDKAIVSSLTLPNEDPHFIREKPTFKTILKDADMLVSIGNGLEIWLKKVLIATQNPKILESAQGFINTSQNSSLLEVPSNLSKSQGDIHPQGNPHIWLSPQQTLKIADNIKNGLIKNDPKNKDFYTKNYESFKSSLTRSMFGETITKSYSADFLWKLKEGGKLNEYLAARKLTVGGWVKEMSEMKSSLFTYHPVFSYFAKDFNVKIIADIEEKPGSSPSLKHLSLLRAQAKNVVNCNIVAANYYLGSKGLIEKMANDIKGKFVFIQADASSDESYVTMMDRIVKGFLSVK